MSLLDYSDRNLHTVVVHCCCFFGVNLHVSLGLKQGSGSHESNQATLFNGLQYYFVVLLQYRFVNFSRVALTPFKTIRQRCLCVPKRCPVSFILSISDLIIYHSPLFESLTVSAALNKTY